MVEILYKIAVVIWRSVVGCGARCSRLGNAFAFLIRPGIMVPYAVVLQVLQVPWCRRTFAMEAGMWPKTTDSKQIRWRRQGCATPAVVVF